MEVKMDKSKIKEQLELIQRDAGFMLERLDNSDLNVTEERRILNGVKKARRELSNMGAIM